MPGTLLLQRRFAMQLQVLQDLDNVARTVLFLLGMPRGTVIAELMVRPDLETSWP